jgi:hypothetical protein
MLGGIGYSLASTVMIFTALGQMWLPRAQWPQFWSDSTEPPAPVEEAAAAS